MKWFLGWLEQRGRKRIVMDRVNNEPYLERYYVFLKDRKWFPFNVFVHKFLKSDPDDLHDHPWPYFTLILKGGYYEWIPLKAGDGSIIGQKKVWRGPGHFRFCRSSSLHRIELHENIVAWTLFMPGPHLKDWGFIHKGQWIQHEQYLNNRLFK
jgi:hypothetical protein